MHPSFTGNSILDLSLLAWFVAQLIKLILEMIVHRSFDITKMWSSGGMPSSHSSFVCSAAAAIGVREGTQSSLFALAVVFSFVVMYDACHVRRAAGEQAKILNLLRKKMETFSPLLAQTELKELLGHTPLQVCAGAALGVCTGYFGMIYLIGL